MCCVARMPTRRRIHPEADMFGSFCLYVQVFSNKWQDYDMYGRRPPVPGYLLGPYHYTPIVATLDFGTYLFSSMPFCQSQTV